MSSKGSYFIRSMSLLNVLVNETSEDAPLTREEICGSVKERTGVYMKDDTYRSLLELLEQSGIYISKRRSKDKPGHPYEYWYSDGWI